MRPFTGLLTLCLLAAGAASGQPPSPARTDSLREDFHGRLVLALDLGDAQRQSLRDLRQRLQEELDLLRLQIAEGLISPRGGRVRYRQAIDAYGAGRDSVLTADQLALIDRARRYQRQRWLDPGQHLEPMGLADLLYLSPEQRRQWLQLLTQLRGEVAALKKAGRPPSPDDYEVFQERHRTGFEELLTASQRVELERLELAERRRQEEQERLSLLERYGAMADSAAGADSTAVAGGE